MCQADEFTSGTASSAPAEPLQAGVGADAGIQVDSLGGNCPVQACGLIDGEPFYFRARWSHWSLSIGSDKVDESSCGVYGRDVVGAPRWYHEEDWGGDFEAGWMPKETAREMIAKGAAMYRSASAQLPIEERSDDEARLGKSQPDTNISAARGETGEQ